MDNLNQKLQEIMLMQDKNLKQLMKQKHMDKKLLYKENIEKVEL